MAKHFEEILLL